MSTHLVASSRFVRSRWIAIVVAGAMAIVIVGGAWGLYAWRGTPLAIDRDGAIAVNKMAAKPASATPMPSMEALAQRLALKLRTQTPDDGEGWALLARSYVELKQYREAADAFAQAAKRVPPDATLLADYAEALSMAKGKTPAPAASAAQAGADPGASISGSVRIAPDLAAKLAPGDTLFVYARAITGPAIPLAIVRTPAAFPFAFRLDEHQAMLPELSLSRVAEVALTARVSHGGAATPQAGDLEGTVPRVKVGARGVDLVVDQIVR